MRLMSMTILLSGLVGCGVPDDKPLKDFEPDDLERFCSEISGEVRDIECNYDGVEVFFEVGQTYEDCIETYEPTLFEDCDLTAGNIRDCESALAGIADEDFCALDTGYPEACADLVACIFVMS